MQTEVRVDTETQQVLSAIQANLDALVARGYLCSMLFGRDGVSQKIDGTASSGSGLRIVTTANYSHLLKENEHVVNRISELAFSVEDESERMRAIFSTISTMARAGESAHLRDVETLADIGCSSALNLGEFGDEIRGIIPA